MRIIDLSSDVCSSDLLMLVSRTWRPSKRSLSAKSSSMKRGVLMRATGLLQTVSVVEAEDPVAHVFDSTVQGVRRLTECMVTLEPGGVVAAAVAFQPWTVQRATHATVTALVAVLDPYVRLVVPGRMLEVRVKSALDVRSKEHTSELQSLLRNS